VGFFAPQIEVVFGTDILDANLLLCIESFQNKVRWCLSPAGSPRRIDPQRTLLMLRNFNCTQRNLGLGELDS
jgi:hypothetical protein